ncbi:MAG: PaaI family thioesterase, partial [Myxococcota bacterium]|nr:PaaI family thioesterase [Myxococcota bacterium]
SHCTVRLGQRHVGAPGMVHGGILAACFDQVSGHCAVVSGHPGLTVSLHVQYQGPAHVEVDLQFVAELEQVAGREITVSATCSRQGEQIASCRAIFVTLDEEQGQTLFHGA